MKIRPVIKFRSGFPDDMIMADDDEIAHFPGRNIAETLKMQFESLGYKVSAPIEAFELGWELDIQRSNKRLSLRVSLIDDDENYLFADQARAWLWPDTKLFRAFLSDLQSILQADGRFSVIGWYAQGSDTFGEAAASGPFDA